MNKEHTTARNMQAINTEGIQFERYPAYKDSGVEWLGEVPAHWETLRMKRLFKDVSEKNKPDAELLSVTQSQGVVPRSWVETRMVMPSGNLESFKFIREGDFAISLRSFEGGLEYCHHEGIISPAYTVLRQTKDLYSHFYKYLFKSAAFISELQTSVVGIREGKNISYPELSYSFLPIPPLPEQTRIATFLDHKTALIDKAIAQKERLIGLLQERRQVLIHRAVTRGLDPDVQMKDSGVEWIGEVPGHWEVKKLKHLVKIQGGFAFQSADFKDTGIQLLRIGNIYKNRLSLERQPVFLNESFLESHQEWAVEKNDILMSLTGTLGKRDYGYAILIKGKDRFLLNQRVAKLTTLEGVEPEYIVKVLQSEMYLNQLYRLPAGTKQANLSNDNVINIKIPFPPSSTERNGLIYFLNDMGKNIKILIRNCKKEINLLQELKSTLIDAAVTGKVRV